MGAVWSYAWSLLRWCPWLRAEAMLTDLVTNPLHVKLEDKYVLSTKLLGKGASARVFEGIRKDTNEKVAIKRITKGIIDH